MSQVNIIHEVTVRPDEFRKVLQQHVGSNGIPVVTHVTFTSLLLSNYIHQEDYMIEPAGYIMPLSFVQALTYLDNSTLGTYSVRMGNVIFVTTLTE